MMTAIVFATLERSPTFTDKRVLSVDWILILIVKFQPLVGN